MKNKISTLIRVVTSFGLLGFLIWFMRGDIAKIGSSLAAANLNIIGICVISIFINTLMQAYRLKTIFCGENLNITFKESVEFTFVGYFFNNFMPTAVGGDIVKAHYAASANGKKVESYASVFMDRIIGLYTFIVVAAAALILDQGKMRIVGVKPVVFGLIVMGVIGYIVVTHKNIEQFMERAFNRIKMFGIGKKLHSLYLVVHDYRNRGDIVIKSVIISLCGQGLYFISVYLIFKALGGTVAFGNILLIMPIVVFISMIPSLGGLGVREGAIVALFSPLVGRDMAFSASHLCKPYT